MSTRSTWSALCLFALAVTAHAQGADTVKPADVLKQIADLRASRLADARSGKPYNAQAVQVEANELARRAIEGVDPAKVAAADALDWARLFADADKQKEAATLAQAYLTTGPAPEKRFDAQLLLLDGLAATGDGKQIATILPGVVAPNPSSGGLLFSKTTRTYVPILAKAVGLAATFRVIDKVEKGVPREDPAKAAAVRLEAEKARREKAGLGPIEDEAAERAKFEQQIKGSWAIRGYFAAKAKSDLLIEAGKRKDAAAVLEQFIKATDPANTVAVRAANSARLILTLPGESAPEIKRLSSIGDFAGVGALKGKVVILDFFAHWCGPCVASIPDTRQLLEDLKGKGLAVVGVTQYQGYYGREGAAKRDLPRDVEEQRMHDFVRDKGITWPVVFVEREVFDAYGVQGIPHVVVLDRQGKIHKIEVGYSPELFKAFRAEVEHLVGG